MAQGIFELMTKIYRTIRDRFTTFKLFFQKYTKKPALTYTDFNRFLNEFSLSADTPILKGMYTKLNPLGNPEIMFENFRNAFEKEIDSELGVMITHMGFILEEKNLTFLQLIQNNS